MASKNGIQNRSKRSKNTIQDYSIKVFRNTIANDILQALQKYSRITFKVIQEYQIKNTIWKRWKMKDIREYIETFNSYIQWYEKIVLESTEDLWRIIFKNIQNHSIMNTQYCKALKIFKENIQSIRRITKILLYRYTPYLHLLFCVSFQDQTP